jgi:4-carboxymuconolactone decarboxylase
MTRFPSIALAERTPAQAAMTERATTGGPFEMYQRSPELWERLQPIRQLLAERFTPRQREIAVLAVAGHWHARAAIGSHGRLARQADLDDTAIAAILSGAAPELQDDERLLLACTRSLLSTGRLPDALFAMAEAQFGAQLLVDLTGLVGFYTGLSLVLNLGEADADPVSA